MWISCAPSQMVTAVVLSVHNGGQQQEQEAKNEIYMYSNVMIFGSYNQLYATDQLTPDFISHYLKECLMCRVLPWDAPTDA
ncbi:unnamed protein product [Urochloa humidicola]